MSSKVKNIVLTSVVNVCRLVLAATFLFSGFVKANDPLGTVYKIEDYLAAWDMTAIPRIVILVVSLLLAFFEYGLGIYLLLGLRRKIVSLLMLVFMTVMTLFTVYIAIYEPVSDCGCFGDAIILSNTQTLLKNVVLLVCAVIVFKWHGRQWTMLGQYMGWIVAMIAMLGIVAYSTFCIYALPVIDFRPYKVGTDLREMVTVPDEQRPQFKVTLVYERNGETLELDIDDDDPDDSWTYVETKREEIVAADHNIISDFYIENMDGDDVATELLETEGYVFLLVAPVLQTADQSIMDKINDLYDYTLQQGLTFVCITASDNSQRERWIDYTGAEYPFLTSDERMMKTMVRANPGLVLLRDGVVMKKWSNWNFPLVDEVEDMIAQ